MAEHDAPRASDSASHSAVAPRSWVVAAVVDVFVYVVVLNLFVEYLPSVISETFALSLLTALLLKVVLEVVYAAKNRVKSRFRSATSVLGKVGAGFLLWLVLFGSKFVVLEVVDLVFGSGVSLGGFFSVTALILVLLAARAGVRRLLLPGDPAGDPSTNPSTHPTPGVTSG